MQRRDFFRNGIIAGVGGSLIGNFPGHSRSDKIKEGGTAKNIIILVSDGMSMGTLTMADLLRQTKEGRGSHWMDLYRENKVTRGLMDTASKNSLVTDSAAASSAWGGGHRVANGSLNVGIDGEEYKPILQKFKSAGKAVGCVTTVQITHATPAGFCISSKSRGSQAEIAEKYLPLKFDVMMGGGDEYFNPGKRKDQKDLYGEFKSNGYSVVRTKEEMKAAESGKPLLGVFHDNALPFTIDHLNDENLIKTVPTLAEMTEVALNHLQNNKKGFVLQVEAGKVDWAAHANDSAGILYDQLAFDDAIKVALDFAERDQNTLVIITTDHGNANPGLFSGKDANTNFARIHNFKQSNDWLLFNIKPNDPIGKVIDLIKYNHGYEISSEEATLLISYYENLDSEGVYNPYKLPFKTFAEIQARRTNISFAGVDHSADFVEIAMLGPGSEKLRPLILNTDLHYFMLEATETENN